MDTRDDCKGCGASVWVSDDKIEAQLDEYLKLLDEAVCVTEEIYRKRLTECSSCSGLYYGSTCRYCGCFVRIRAKRKDKGCPFPEQSRW